MKLHLPITVETLLRQGRGQREIERLTGVDRKTIRRLDRAASEGAGAKSPEVATGCDGADCGTEADENPPPRPPARPPKQARSACEGHREWIEKQLKPAACYPRASTAARCARPSAWPGGAKRRAVGRLRVCG